MSELLAQLDEISRGDERVAMATLVATHGTTPKKEGAKMCVGAGGRVLGSVTIGGSVDAKVMEISRAVLQGAGPKLFELPLGDEDAGAIGLSCGCAVEVLAEELQAPLL